MKDYVEDLINRNVKNDALLKQSELISKVVDFGTLIIKWDVERNDMLEEKNQIPALFLRKLIELYDSISILVGNSSIKPCKILIRSAHEIFMQLCFLLDGDTERKSISYLVWMINENIKFLIKNDPETLQGKQHFSNLKKDRYLSDSISLDSEYISNRIVELNKVLEIPRYSIVAEELERLKSIGSKNPMWYSFYDGPKNIEQLAHRVEQSGMYNFFYRVLSKSTHGNDIYKGIFKIDPNNNSISILELRNSEDSMNIVFDAQMLGMETFKFYIEKRIPEKVNSYQEWAVKLHLGIKEEVKKAASNIKN